MESIKTLKIKAFCFYMEGDFLWLCSKETGVLCKYSLKEEKIVFMQTIPCKGSYRAIIGYEGKLILIPHMAERILVFDTNKEMFEEIELPEVAKSFRNDLKFVYGFKKGCYVYLVPGNYPYVLRINMKSYEVSKSENLVQICREYSGRLEGAVCFSAFGYDGDHMLYLAFDIYYTDQIGEYNCNSYIGLCKVDTDTFQIKVKMLPYVNEDIKGMICYEDKLFLYSGEGYITVLNRNMNNIEVLSDAALFDYKNPYYLYIEYACAYDGKLIFVRRRGLKTLIVDLNNKNKITKKKLIEEWIISVGLGKNGLFLQPDEEGVFYIVEKESCKKKSFRIESSVIQNCIQKIMEDNTKILYENAVLQLFEWVDAVPSRDSYAPDVQSTGKEIYSYIRKNL